MLLSIITINFNNLKGLDETLASVSSQTFKDFELIVIDGNSTDGSVDLIKQYAHVVSDWVSEPDRGIYHAQNKGIKRSQGDYLLFLNSGDVFFENDILQRMVQYLDGTDIVYGDLEIVEPDRRWVKKYSQPITFGYFLRDTLPHQASFIKRKILEKSGDNFDENLFISADWKFFLEAICRHNASLKYVGEVISCYDYTGISSVKENNQRMRGEKIKVLETEYARFYFEFKELKSSHQKIRKSRFMRMCLGLRNIFSSDKINSF